MEDPREQGDQGEEGRLRGGSALLRSCWAVCARFLCVTSLNPHLPHLGPTRTCDQPDFPDVKNEIQRGQVPCQGCVGSGGAGITKPLGLKPFSVFLSPPFPSSLSSCFSLSSRSLSVFLIFKMKNRCSSLFAAALVKVLSFCILRFAGHTVLCWRLGV